MDVLFIDEAEYTWPRFLQDYQAGSWKPEYVQTEKPSMHDSPLPRFDLLKIDQYRMMPIQFARGCPFQCEFCDIIVMYGRRPRTKTVDQAMAEVIELHRLGMREVFIVDDNFIGNKKEAKDLLCALADWQKANNWPMEIMTEVTLNIAQEDELLRLMREANFTTIFVGIESPRAASLRETKKTQNLRADILESVHKIQGFGIEVMAGMIIGFDNDDASIFDEHFRFIQDADIPISMTGLLKALPRTPLYQRLEEAGRLIEWDTTGDRLGFTNVVPLAMSVDELQEGFKNLMLRLYGYRNYRRRVMQLTLRRRPRARVGKPRPEDLRLFARVLKTCIFDASPRRAWFTLSIIVETALRRPREMKRAVALALLHKHLYEYARAAFLVERTAGPPERVAGKAAIVPEARSAWSAVRRVRDIF